MKSTTTSSGSRVAYATSRQKEDYPLILLHGFCEDISVWDPILSQLQPDAFLRIDLPGFGGSEPIENASMAAYAEAVLAVLDAESITKCVLVGHSLGGYAALEFASRWPERLLGLGLFHSHPFEDSAEKKATRQRGIETLQAGKRDLYVSQLFPNLFTPEFLEKHPEILQELITTGKKQSPEGIIGALQAMIDRKDHQATLSGLNGCPVLFLLGKQDTLVPPEEGLKAAKLPPITDLQMLPEAAHMAMYECPEETAVILNSFWDFCQSENRNS